MKNKNLGMLVLAVFLILTGIAGFVDLGALVKAIPILAIAAGVLILIGK